MVGQYMRANPARCPACAPVCVCVRAWGWIWVCAVVSACAHMWVRLCIVYACGVDMVAAMCEVGCAFWSLELIDAKMVVACLLVLAVASVS